MFVYCEKCALITKQKQVQQLCPACELLMKEVPQKYLTSSGNMFASQALKKEFEESVKQTEVYDSNANLERDEIIDRLESEHKAKVEEKVSAYNQSRVRLTCPNCHSHNISKISNVGKIVKVGAFGILGAGDIGKKYKCDACGYKY